MHGFKKNITTSFRRPSIHLPKSILGMFANDSYLVLQALAWEDDQVYGISNSCLLIAHVCMDPASHRTTLMWFPSCRSRTLLYAVERS